MMSTQEAELDLPSLPLAARKIHLLPELTAGHLISVGQFTDAGCSAHFYHNRCEIYYQDKLVLYGHRSGPNQLWLFDHENPTGKSTAGQANALRPASLPSKTKSADIVAFHHASLGSPSLSTLQKALDAGYLPGFPGLTSQTLRLHPPFSVAEIKGHQDHVRKNVQSTKPKPPKPKSPKPTSPPEPSTAPMPSNDDDVNADFFPVSEEPNERTHFCYLACEQVTGQVYSDLTGKFPIPSSNGNKYILIAYDYDSNCIFAEPLASREAKNIVAAFKKICEKLKAAGLTPKFQRLDNECSKLLKDYFEQNNIDFQLAPPDNHRRNAAERAIRTFKNHFIAMLCSADRDFPLHLWCLLLQQAFITLNLLRGSRINPKLSAYAQVNGHFDYNRTPIGPPGCKVQAHAMATNRDSWSPHAEDAWYVGPAMNSYRCFQVWIVASRSRRIVDTLTWHPLHVEAPIPTTEDAIIAAAQELAKALNQDDADRTLKFLQDDQVDALKALGNILGNHSRDASVDPLPTISESNDTAISPRVATPTNTADSPRVPAAEDTTWHEASGVTGRRRRQARRRANKKASTPTAPVQQPTHQHNTRHRAKATPPVANSAIADAPSTPTMEFCPNGEIYMHSAIDLMARANKAVHPDTGKLAEYQQLKNSSEGHLWERSCAIEMGRLAQGLPPEQPTGRDTFRFIPKSKVPKGAKVTYLRIVSTYRPQKDLPHRVRFTCGGNLLEYPGKTSTRTADLTTFKICVNKVLSTDNAEAACFDLSDFYLCHRLDYAEYMRIHRSTIPQRVIDQYDLEELFDEDGYVYCEIVGGMYGLKQAGIIANRALVKHLKTQDYEECKHTHGLFKHKSRPVFFSLVVDDFFVGYVGKDNAEHLRKCLAQRYTVACDWNATLFCGITMQWDYKKRLCDMSMPSYVAKALQRFEHSAPTRSIDSPSPWTAPVYGAKQQMATPIDTGALISEKERTRIQ